MVALSMEKNYIFFVEDSHLSEEAVALYIDALEMHNAYLLPGAVLEHVDNCEKCKSEIIEALSLVEESVYKVQEPHPYLVKKPRLTLARFSSSYRIAAVFLIGISVGTLFYFFEFMKDDRSTISDSVRSMLIAHPEIRKSPAKNNQINQQKTSADNFSESPNLEDLVNSVSRSESPLAVSPKNNADVGREILFRWNIQDAGSVSLTILSNREEVLKNVKVNKSKYFFSGKLDRGLDHWKLEHKDELLYVGKFFVR